MKKLMILRRQASTVLRALATVAMADGELDPREFRYIEMHARMFGIEDDFAIDPIEPEEVADSILDEESRGGLIQRMVVMTMLDEEIHPDELATMRRFAKALRVEEPAINQMQSFVQGRMRLLALDLGRRSFLGKQLSSVWNEQGLRGTVKLVKAAAGVGEPALAARYLALADLPEGTLGHELVAHCRRNDFKLPGEPKGAPEALIFHDLGHVLSGYPATAEGEVGMGGFEAGYMGEDGFSVTLLALYAFHLNAPIIPKGYTSGAFDLDVYTRAYTLGRRLKTDLRGWDAWPHMDKPLEIIRGELGLVSGAPV